MPSTSLRDIAYDADARTLEVTFLASGRRYRSFDVAPEEHAALRHAFSKGTPVNRHIKPTHRLRAGDGHAARWPRFRWAHFCDHTQT